MAGCSKRLIQASVGNRYGVPSLAGPVLRRQRVSKHLGVQGKSASGRLKPGLHTALMVRLVLLFLLFQGLSIASAAPARQKKPRPAQFKISGYGLLGDWELKRILRTVELGGKKPEYFASS